MPIRQVSYVFEFPTGEIFQYDLRIDATTLSLVPETEEADGTEVTYPDWTRLGHCQCQHCPLPENDQPRCPISVNVAQLVDAFRDVYSTLPVKISVHTDERTYLKEGPVQRGLASILGLIMATSGCPHMNFLKPMARFHLPFATSEETIVRSTSMYLLAQYFIARRGEAPDMKLTKLDEAYARVQKVNFGVSARIRSAAETSRGDASSNAVVILFTVAQLLSTAIEENLDAIEDLFKGIVFP